MGLYNFEPRFVPAILDGRKRHTIRAIRANPDKPGNVLHLYTGLRHPGAKLLMRVPCVRVETISIGEKYIAANPLPAWITVVRVSDIALNPDECSFLAQADGFTCFREMMEFWEGRLPFEGHIIHWDYEKRLRCMQ